MDIPDAPEVPGADRSSPRRAPTRPCELGAQAAAEDALPAATPRPRTTQAADDDA